jgi:peptidoglycan/LPS O-acetylase OafA/YrhL
MTEERASGVSEPVVGASPRRVAGLNMLRFVCALVVMMGHIGLLSDRLRGAQAVGLAKVGIGLYHSLFNGPAAVIIFFLISGFCIHFPFRDGRRLEWDSFYSRRFVRILLPAAVCIVVTRWVSAKFSLWDSVLWSVICEAIYYLIYPVLLFCRRRVSWMLLTAISVGVAGAVIATHRSLLVSGNGYMVLGWELTWMVGLPCWLLGCWLAEHYTSFAVPSVTAMWVMRIGIYALSMGLRLARFHMGSVMASNCIALDLFAIPACVWLGFEIAYATRHRPRRGLEWAGGWSYSLYLVHMLVFPVLAWAGLSYLGENDGTHLLLVAMALLASYGFYVLVERPSHRLAVAAGRFAEVRAARRSVLGA